jgi:hypothetical protein
MELRALAWPFLMASTTGYGDAAGDPSNNWPVNSQGSYDAHSRARQELWRAPTGHGVAPTAPYTLSASRRSVDDEGYIRMSRYIILFLIFQLIRFSSNGVGGLT